MLDRAGEGQAAAPADPDAGTRPVAFRGAGFAPRAGRTSGWIALALVIGCGNSPAASRWSIRCSCHRRPPSRARSGSSRSQARSGIICRFRS